MGWIYAVQPSALSLLLITLFVHSKHQQHRHRQPSDDTQLAPVRGLIFDSTGNTIFSGELGTLFEGIHDERVELGPVLGWPSNHWHYVSYTYTADSIGGFIIGGDSEPTHLDRLDFTVPEPSSALLLLTGLLITAFRFRKVH
jgi:hypothetical protein